MNAEIKQIKGKWFIKSDDSKRVVSPEEMQELLKKWYHKHKK